MTEPLRVDVICGGPGREAAVSRRSGTAVAAGLRQRGHDVAVIDLADRLDPARLRRGAVAFNIVHGTYGEDGVLQAELDALGVAYVGSDAAVSRLCMDKPRAKERLAAAGIRVPWGAELILGQPLPTGLALPAAGGLVLKPADDGSSVGLRIIDGRDQLPAALAELAAALGPRRYLIEEQLPGPEYTVPVIDGDAGPLALPSLFIKAAGVFDYAAKYQRDDTVEEPVRDPGLDRRIGAIGLAAYRACGCRDFTRIDVMATADGGLAVLELNTLPGMTDRSLVPKAAAAAGIPFADLVDRLARRAAARGACTARGRA
jgi:D-alanine-D-alanine ligase